jgi:hypothetical protein
MSMTLALTDNHPYKGDLPEVARAATEAVVGLVPRQVVPQGFRRPR